MATTPREAWAAAQAEAKRAYWAYEDAKAAADKARDAADRARIACDKARELAQA